MNHQRYTSAKMSGLFYSKHKAGDYVEKDELIGYTTNAFGKTIEEHRAPQAGIILYMLATPAVNKGDTIACVSAAVEE